ncbi:ParB N-terminal domain-containing protein [Actinomadura sp. NPDC047616]|uniref:ParB/RepB/Spo0J family partition protein n=1 Tax=Actinomadura sp. NPDC047616 TaxID=3155914 RepID=UPI0033C8B91A
MKRIHSLWSTSTRAADPESPPAPTPSAPAPTAAVLAISELRGDFAIRRDVDEEHVHRLHQTEERLPPILVHHSTLRIIDGVHRLRAAALGGRQEIEVEFFYGDEEDAFIRAVAENTRHGLPLPLADRKAAALRILAARPHWSDRAIGQRAGLAAKTVAALRQRSTADGPELNARTGVDGRTRPMSGVDGRLRAAQVIDRRPDAPLREIARIAGVSVGTAHDVRRRMREGQDPVPAGLRRAAEAARRPRDEALEKVRIDTTARDATAPPAKAEEGQDAPVDLSPLLQQLTKDPSLRQSVLGRRLLQLLNTRSLTVADWYVLVDAIPPHRLTTIALIARQCADSWERFADALEERANPSP